MSTKTTVKTYLDVLLGDTLGAEWSFTTWIAWPPDVFAATALLLKQTGMSICVVHPPPGRVWPEEEDWSATIQQHKAAWYQWMINQQALPPAMAQCQQRLVDAWDIVTLEDLGQLTTADGYANLMNTKRAAATWTVCTSILTLHALADEICAGFGIPSGNNWTHCPNEKTIHWVANMQLMLTGSLSQLPPRVVQVLPKMRTPEVGLTLRSLSHHLTIHQTEVEIVWRTMPWVNSDENTINMLIIPWPYEMEATWFQPSTYATPRNSREETRYFTYHGSREDLSADHLLRLITDAERSVRRVHLVILPELALTHTNLDTLLDMLAREKRRDQVPMILTGIRDVPEPGKLGTNKVVLSTFFAGKWYKLEQQKHHRWRLDRGQIQQYNLGGVLAGNTAWWEAIQLSKRQLSVLAPNSW